MVYLKKIKPIDRSDFFFQVNHSIPDIWWGQPLIKHILVVTGLYFALFYDF